jgi:hypothetical protein
LLDPDYHWPRLLCHDPRACIASRRGLTPILPSHAIEPIRQPERVYREGGDGPTGGEDHHGTNWARCGSRPDRSALGEPIMRTSWTSSPGCLHEPQLHRTPRLPEGTRTATEESSRHHGFRIAAPSGGDGVSTEIPFLPPSNPLRPLTPDCAPLGRQSLSSNSGIRP